MSPKNSWAVSVRCSQANHIYVVSLGQNFHNPSEGHQRWFPDGCVRRDVFDRLLFLGVFQAKENAKRFSNLSKQNREEEVIKWVRELFPQVRNLTIETIGGQPVLYALMDSLPEKIPVSVLSGGINKYLAILLAICVNDEGAVLIDDFENGFYYQNYKDIARSLITACEVHKVQLFASSHSYEFLQAILPAVSEKEDSFYAYSVSQTTKVSPRLK